VKPIRILIVDDSSVVRRVLSHELEKQPDFQVVGSAVDPYAARDRIVELEPDVITLDIEMPRMDGLEFLEKLMRYRPTPVVIVSSLAPEGSETAMRALALGAVDIIAKPNNQYSSPDIEPLCRAIRAASTSRPRASQAMPIARRSRSPKLDVLRTTDKLIAIGLRRWSKCSRRSRPRARAPS
jgi:two-component system chemotaxis response regulator CheB